MSDVVRVGFLGEIVEHILRQPRWQILRHIVMVVGVGTGVWAVPESCRCCRYRYSRPKLTATFVSPGRKVWVFHEPD